MKTRLEEIDRFFENLPPARPESDIRAEYGARIRDGLDRFSAATAGRRLSAARGALAAAVDVAVVLLRSARASALKIAACGSDAVASLLDAIAPQAAFSPVYARGAGNEDVSAPAAEVVKNGDGCSLRAEVRAAGETADVSIELLDAQGKAVSPFALSVKDATGGETLLAGRVFSMGLASLAGVERGRYEIEADGSGHRCSMVLDIG